MKRKTTSFSRQRLMMIFVLLGAVLANDGLCSDYSIKATVIGIDEYRTKKKDLSGIEVTLTGPILREQQIEKTDQDGVAMFTGIPAHGVYELIAKTDVIIDGKTVRSAARAFTQRNSRDVLLILRTDWVTLKGKVVNADGTPAAGAHISLRPLFLGDAASARYDAYPQQDAVSEPDGSFIMPHVKPLDTDLAALYLVSSNSVLSQAKFFYGLIYAKKPQVIGDGKPQLMIPLISENILNQARRDIAKANESNKKGYVIKEQENIGLPKSEGDVIFLPDIMLGDDEPKPPAAANDPKTKK